LKQKGCKNPPLLEHGICTKCLSIGEVSRHHIYPTTFFLGNKHTKKITMLLCEKHHVEITRILPSYKMSQEFYLEIHQIWLKGGAMSNKKQRKKKKREEKNEEEEFDSLAYYKRKKASILKKQLEGWEKA